MEVSNNTITISETFEDTKLKELLESKETDEKTKKHLQHEFDYVTQTKQFYASDVQSSPSTDVEADTLNDPLKFYENILSLASENMQQLNRNINIFLSGADTSEIRMQTISSFWKFCFLLFEEKIDAITPELRYLLRFGVLVTSTIAPSLLNIIKRVDISAPVPAISVYYVDEWLELVSKGTINPTILNEIEVTNEETQIINQQNKLVKINTQINTLIMDAMNIDKTLTESINLITTEIAKLSNRQETEYGFLESLTQEQIKTIALCKNEFGKLLSRNDMLETKMFNIQSEYKNIQKTQNELEKLNENTTEENQFSIEPEPQEKKVVEKRLISKLTTNELAVIRQMSKICVGKRGNHFPFLHHKYFSGPVSNFGTKDRVIKIIKEIEDIDYLIFKKEIKGNAIRGFPQIVLVPCYGNHGTCWEPFEKYNKSTTNAKIAIPMYSQNLIKAVMEALGDFRWQFDKERHGHLWMEEGLTGWYYQWFDTNIKKGDIKLKFIEDYMNWIQWEYKGVQKLDKEVREIFWRFIPFKHIAKQELAKRSNAYSELVKKDEKRIISGIKF